MFQVCRSRRKDRRDRRADGFHSRFAFVPRHTDGQNRTPWLHILRGRLPDPLYQELRVEFSVGIRERHFECSYDAIRRWPDPDGKVRLLISTVFKKFCKTNRQKLVFLKYFLAFH